MRRITFRRTHLALQKDAPLHRAVQRSGTILAIPILAGLHHQYGRIVPPSSFCAVSACDERKARKRSLGCR
jgi:hypothetical protein